MVREFGKRTLEEDHDPDEEMEDPGSRKRQRRAEVSEIEARFESLIQRVGEKSSSSLVSNVEGLVAVLEADLAARQDRILEILLRSVLHFPHKAQIYAAIAALLNVKEAEFGAGMVEGLVEGLKGQLRAGAWDEAYASALCLAELFNGRVVSAHSLLAFFGALADTALDETAPQGRADFYVRLALHCLAVAGTELHKAGKTAQLADICDLVQRHMAGRNTDHVPLLRVWDAQEPHPQLDSLHTLWLQVKKVKEGGWNEPGTVRLASHFARVTSEALQHQIPPFTPPAHQPQVSVYPLPSVTFRMYHYTDCPEDAPGLPESDSIDRFLVEQDLAWILRTNYLERKVCAEALMSYAGKRPVPLNYCVLEVVFGELFRLPKSPYLPVCLGSILIELCKIQTESMPQALAQTAELFYQRLESMAPGVVDRLVDWFAYHLSNFHFRWSWEDWTETLEMPELAPKRLFVKEVLYKCQRLSYHQYMVELLPKKFHGLLPPKPEPEFKYASEEAAAMAGTALAHQLAQAIRNKASSDDIIALLNETPDPGEDPAGGTAEFNPVAVEAFTLTLLHLGSKSFSHSFAALAKYHGVFRHLAEGSDAAQLLLLHSLHSLWRCHPHMVIVLVDKMLKMQVVECGVVVEWLFSPPLRDQLLRLWVWEVLDSALLKLSRHVARLRTETQRAEDAVEERAAAKAAKAQAKDQLPDADESEGGAEGGAEGRVEAAAEAETDAESKELAELAEQLEGAEGVQRAFLLGLFQKLSILLTEELVRAEAAGEAVEAGLWYQGLLGRLRHVFLVQWEEAGRHSQALQDHIFTSDTDPHILQLFRQFQALRP